MANVQADDQPEKSAEDRQIAATGFSLSRAAWLARLLGLLVFATCLFPLGRPFFMTPFREAQTAITVRYLDETEGGPLYYPTPVLGAPWSVPYELGVFQELVDFAPLRHLPEVDRGRWVSVAMLLVCVSLVYRLCRDLGLDPARASWSSALFAVGPSCLAYSTAYMIESTALALALGFLILGWRGVAEHRCWCVLATIAVGCISAMVKPTTWSPWAAGLGLFGAWLLWHDLKNGARRTLLIRLAVLCCVLLIPLASALFWTRATDQVKELNALGHAVTSGAQREWNYGTLAQKTSPAVWAFILGKALVLTFGPLGVFVPFVVGGAIWRTLRLRKTSSVALLLAVVAAFLVAPLTFTNLHFRHSYYLVANCAFLVLAVVLSLNEFEGSRWHRWIAYGLPISAVITAALFVQFQRALTQPAEDQVVAVLRTVPNAGPVAFIGFGWSSYMPYQAGRKAMFLGDGNGSIAQREAIRRNSREGFAAVVWQGPNDQLAKIAASGLLGVGGEPREVWPGVWIVVRPECDAAVSVALQQPNPSVEALAILHARLDSTPNPGNPLLFIRWNSSHGGLEFALRRGRDVFFFQSGPWKLWRLNGVFTGDIRSQGNVK